MSGGTFASVADENNQFTFRDLRIQPKEGTTFRWTGRWMGGIQPGEVEVLALRADGSAERTYYWQYVRTGTLNDWTEKSGWLKYNGSTYVDLTDEELDEKFNEGRAFWIMGKGHSLQPAGRVDKRPINFVLNETDYTGAGNGTPVDLTLGDLSIVPKEGTTFRWTGRWMGGIQPGELEVLFLRADGSAEHTFYWQYIRTGTLNDWVEKSGWLKYEGGKYVDATEDDLAIEVPAGKGLWIMGKGHSLHIPSPLPEE